MSDGMYFFKETLGHDSFSGVIEVSQGKLRGENDSYQYHGVFSIKDHILQGSILIKNKETQAVERIPLSGGVPEDNEFRIGIDINGKVINLLLQKQMSRPSMR
jgi:hypothetical protein